MVLKESKEKLCDSCSDVAGNYVLDILSDGWTTCPKNTIEEWEVEIMKERGDMTCSSSTWNWRGDVCINAEAIFLDVYESECVCICRGVRLDGWSSSKPS
jgi:hypothetical protein